jgi:hypothetical protein
MESARTVRDMDRAFCFDRDREKWFELAFAPREQE